MLGCEQPGCPAGLAAPLDGVRKAEHVPKLHVEPLAKAVIQVTMGTSTTSRGKLHTYLGIAPGVGKTYVMLREGTRRPSCRARRRRRLLGA